MKLQSERLKGQAADKARKNGVLMKLQSGRLKRQAADGATV